jgi:pimeloyl-ACP methyl ester carboxylesterase
LATLVGLTSQTTLAGRFLNRSGMALTYVVRGAGPILVCHPGGPGFSSEHLRDLGGLDKTRTLVLLNPRGTAGSDRPADPRAYELDDYGNDLEDLRLHLGLEAMDLLGQSHGGVVAMDYAARFPRRVTRLLLITTLARFAAAQREAMEKGMAKRSAESWYVDAVAALEEEQAGSFSSDEEMGALWLREAPFYFARFGESERAYVESLAGETVNADALRLFNTEAFETFDLRRELGRITARTLVLVGEDDFITGPAAAADMTEGIPNCELVTVPGGHFVFIESPDAFREGVVRFLEKG